jgi:carboxynorspermidine decarboxylase
MEEDKLRRNLSLIRDVSRRADVNIILAFKAFALWKSFGVFREYIQSTTASSLYEARLAKEEFGEKAHTYSPAYVDEEFDEIVKCSSHITFNSLSQYERFGERARAAGVKCGLRINPEYSEIETELYNPCAPGSRFGVLAEQLGNTLPEGISGLHVHCLCENGSDTLVRTLEHVEARFASVLKQAKWLNLGGGHLMTRDGYDIELLVKTLQGLHNRYPQLKIIMEPGSAFAWQTGYLLAKVVDIVENKSIKTAILNVSFTCHMPDCLEMPYHPAVRGAKVRLDTDKGENVYRLGGNSCLSGDFMSAWEFDKPLKVGDEVIFEDMIHYTTVKTNMFNGISHPSIGMMHSDGRFELFRKYKYEDYRDRMD